MTGRHEGKDSSLLAKLPHYWKTIIAVVPVVIFVGSAVVQAIADAGSISVATIMPIVVSGFAAYGVFQKKNAPKVTSA